MDAQLLEGFQLLDCRVEPLKGVVVRDDGETTKLPRKPMDVLVHLADNAGQVISKQILVDEIWGRHSGGDDGLKKCIHAIRRALHDDNESPRFIQTIHGRGYLCLQTPRAGTSVQPSNSNVVVLARRKVKESGVDTSKPIPGFKGQPAVAVLPFSPLGKFDEGDAHYMCEGVAEDIISALQRFRSLPIISHHSSKRFESGSSDLATISADLGVGYVVDGSLRASEDRIKITVNLTETSGHTVLWSNSYVCLKADLINIDDEITRDIAGQLEPELERAEGQQKLPVDLEGVSAWQLVRRANWHANKLSLKDSEIAHDYLIRALELDANNADALLQLAWLEWWKVAAKRGEGKDWNNIEELSQCALKIDPQNPRVPLMLGIVALMRGEHDTAISHFKASLRFNPSFGWAHTHLGSALYLSGEPEKAMREHRIAIRLSPFDHYMFHTLGDMATCEYMLGRWDKSIEAARNSLALRPNYWLPQAIRISALVAKKDMRAAQDQAQKLLRRRPGFTVQEVDWIKFKDPAWNKKIASSLKKAGL